MGVEYLYETVVFKSDQISSSWATFYFNNLFEFVISFNKMNLKCH